jgi:hypothetical protein
MMVDKEVPHLPHFGPRTIFELKTLFFTPHTGQEMISNSGGDGEDVSAVLSRSSVIDCMKFSKIASFSMSSTPMPFFIDDRGVFIVLLTTPFNREILLSGITTSIVMIVSGVNPRFVLMKIPFAEILLIIPLKLRLPELNVTSSRFVNRG